MQPRLAIGQSWYFICLALPWALTFFAGLWILRPDAVHAPALGGLVQPRILSELRPTGHESEQQEQQCCECLSDNTMSQHAASVGEHHVSSDTVEEHGDGHHHAPPHVGDHGGDGVYLLTERVISAMTLGCVAFQMSLFYIINHPDKDIRRESLSMIGQTISIFCSVLSFSSIYSAVENYLHADSDAAQAVASAGFCIFLFFTMQIIVYVSARVRGEAALKPVHSHFSNQALHMPAHVLNAKTFGALAAQMCAAAIIKGFGHLQLLAYQKEHSLYLTFAVDPAVFWGSFVVVWCIAWVRARIIRLDGIIDEAEETWIKVAEECEDEVISLSSGFHAAVVARVIITGHLPHILLHGLEHHHHPEVISTAEVAMLWMVALACAVICILLNIVFFGVLDNGINWAKLRSDSFGRVIRVFTLSMGMTFAWCTCFGTHMLAMHFSLLQEGLNLRLYIALFQSAASFVMLLVLDKIKDMRCAGPAFQKALVTMMRALGASVGLAWEQAFHTCVHVAVEFMAEDETGLFRASDDRTFWALWLSAAIVVTVLPAYRFYIVPRMYHMIEEHEEELQKEEESYAQTVTDSLGGVKSVLSENMFVWEADTQLPMAGDAGGENRDLCAGK